MAVENPLSKQMRSEARKSAHKLSQCQELINLAKAAGFELNEEQQKCDYLRGMLIGILKVYDHETPRMPEE